MLIVLIGPPAAGKGTQAQKICQHLSIPHISTGDILRQNIKNKTELGLLADALISRGNFVPDRIIAPLVRERIEMHDCLDGCLLDGFPRTISQAEELDKFALVTMVINLTVPADALIRRITGRRVCGVCGKSFHTSNHTSASCTCGEPLSIREDDKEEVFVTRLVNYERQTLPLIRYYEGQNKLISVSGEGSADEVFCEIRRELDLFGQR